MNTENSGTDTPRDPNDRLQVILSGYNGDVEVLRSGSGQFSPETLSAAYARISRSPEPVPELRRQAREQVEKARKSNQTIVFGLGHHSVAEHAVFNFDILGCSRLAIEALEWHRLCSYTEKSQRYITLDGDFVLPKELNGTEAGRLSSLIEEQNGLYQRLLPLLLAQQKKNHPEMTVKKRDLTTLEGWAKEDARYVVSLSTEGQLGFTCNARNLELIVRRMRSAPLEEVRRLGSMLFDEARAIAPSLIILADEKAFREAYGAAVRDGFFKRGDDDLRQAAAAVPPSGGERAKHSKTGCRGDVTLISHTPDPDEGVLAGLLFAAGYGSMSECRTALEAMDLSARRSFFKTAMAHFSEFDSPPRAFEEAVFQFELIIDASAMAQLKRHRMATQQWGPYDPGLGVTVPPMIEAVGQRVRFESLMDHTAEIHQHLKDMLAERGAPLDAADYALTNAHRRRVSISASLRELYHFSRLREDCHAQWAIRQLAEDMSALARERAPVTASLLGGKDRYPEIFRRVMGQEP